MSDERTFKKPLDKAKLMNDMIKEAGFVEARLKAKAVIVIGIFEENGQLLIQDAGKFPMPPADLYQIMIQAHSNGQLANLPLASKIIKPN